MFQPPESQRVIKLENLALKKVVLIAGNIWQENETDPDHLRYKLEQVLQYFRMSIQLQRKLSHVLVTNYRPLTLGHALWLVEKGLDHLDLSCAFSNVSFGVLSSLLSPEARSNLTSLNCTICWLHSHEFLPSTVLDLLPSFPSIRHLWLSYTLCHVTTLSLLVKHCEHLTSLSLTGCDINDAGIACLWYRSSLNYKLTYLDIRGTEVSCAGVAMALQRIPKLREILYEKMVQALLALEESMPLQLESPYVLQRIHFNMLPEDPYPSTISQEINQKALHISGIKCRNVKHISMRMHSPLLPLGINIERYTRLTNLELHFMDGNSAIYSNLSDVIENVKRHLKFLSLRNVRNVPLTTLLSGFQQLERLHLSNIHELIERIEGNISCMSLKRLELSSLSGNIIAMLLCACINVHTLWLHSVDIGTDVFSSVIQKGGLFCLQFASLSYCSIHSCAEINQLMNYSRNLKLLNLHQNAWPVNVVGAEWIAEHNQSGKINTSFMNNLFSEGLQILCPFWACETCQMFRSNSAMNVNVNFMDSIQRLRVNHSKKLDEIDY